MKKRPFFPTEYCQYHGRQLAKFGRVWGCFRCYVERYAVVVRK